MTRRSVVFLLGPVVVVALGLGVARAAEVSDATVGFRLTVPDEVPAVPELAEAVVRDFATQDRYGNTPFRANGKAFADGRAGIGVYVLWLTTQNAVASPADRIVAELAAKATRPESKDAKGDVKLEERLASTRVEYTSPKNGTRTLLRSMVFVDRENKVHEVTAECVLRDEDPGATGPGSARSLCETALASLEITVPEAMRAPIGTPSPRAPEVSSAGSEAPTATSAVPGAPLQPGAPLSVNDVVQDKPSRWPIFAGSGLVLIAIVIVVRQRKRKQKGS